jgi:hypothetical protein
VIVFFSVSNFQFYPHRPTDTDQPTMSISFQFEWKANRNFCVTAKHQLDYECCEAQDARGTDEWLKFALKGSVELIGYFKTEKAASQAMVKCWNSAYPTHANHYSFMWNRAGECVDGCY